MRQALALVVGALAGLASPAFALDLPDGTDPVFAEAFQSCLAAIENDAVLDESLGWTGHDSGDPDAVGWDNWTRAFATKDIDGVGGLNLSVIVEKYPGYELGNCTVGIDQPTAEIDGPNLKHAPGFTGTLQGDGGAWSGAWRNDAATLFIRSHYNEGEYFRFSMTKITTGGGFP
jgi:hypothetical protein